jgi:hypothetical protein
MDEEDIAVPSGSLIIVLGLYTRQVSRELTGETVRKFGYGDSQCEAILDVSHREKPCPVPRVILYNWAAIKIPEGVTMAKSRECATAAS